MSFFIKYILKKLCKVGVIIILRQTKTILLDNFSNIVDYLGKLLIKTQLSHYHRHVTWLSSLTYPHSSTSPLSYRAELRKLTLCESRTGITFSFPLWLNCLWRLLVNYYRGHKLSQRCTSMCKISWLVNPFYFHSSVILLVLFSSYKELSHY